VSERWREEMGRGASEHARRDAARGGAVTLAAQGARFALHIGSTAVLARLLEIEDFGVYAIATTFTMVLAAFRSAGLRYANIQAPSLTHGQASSLLYLNVAIGLALSGLIVGLGPALAALYGEPSLAPVMHVLAVSFFVASVGVQFNGVLHRKMRLGAASGVELGGFALSIGAGIAAATLGAGVLSLALMHLTLQASMTAGYVWLARWRPTRPAPWREVRPLVGFGVSLAGSGMLNQAGSNSDRALLGAVDTQANGLYTKALNLATMPMERVAPAFVAVAIPSLSGRLDQPAAYRRAFTRMLRSLQLLMTPATCLLLVEAELVIGLILGEKWLEAVPLFQTICVGCLLAPVWKSSGWLFVSQGRGRAMFLWHLFDSVAKIAFFGVGLIWGAMGVATAYSLRHIVLLPVLARVAGAKGPVGPGLFSRQAVEAAVLSAPGLAAAWAVRAVGGEAAAWPGIGAASYAVVFGLTILLVPGYREQVVYSVQSLGGRLLGEKTGGKTDNQPAPAVKAGAAPGTAEVEAAR